MLLVNLFNFLRGYIVILVEGYFLEKFINICTRRGIYLWDVKKINSCTMKLKISIRGFKALRPIAYKTKCRVKILAKKGTPFILYRYRKRKTFMIGVLLFFVLLWYMTSFIWVIEVVGNENIVREEIIMYLQQCGLKVGASKIGLDTDIIENEMMLRLSQLSWIGIEIKGTKAVVEVKERKLPPEMVEKHIPCNIIASKDGVIKSMIVKSGQPVVKKGDTIEKGQLLVSGVIDSKVEGIRYIHSIASVKARTWYEKSKEVHLTRLKRIKTGNKITQVSLKFLDNKINLFLDSSIPYANYDKITYSKELSIGKDYVLPVVLESNTFEEVKIEEEKIGLEDAISEAAQQLYEDTKKELASDAQILNQKADHIFVDDDTVVVKLLIESIEEVGMQEEIIKN
ncbi:MAG: putative stage sporulation protein YqfD [Clostridia bacterium]|nr:putative stage sporulation protein YqfD [Clostridia bacterium]